MFTTIALIGSGVLAVLSGYQQKNDPSDPNTLALQTRQDLRLIAYLLGGIAIMLGIIADWIH
jgi:hypothetical protein